MAKRHLRLATSSDEDPIYAAIDRHQAAVAATEASGEDVSDKLSERESALALKLMSTVPTSKAGPLAMLDYTRLAEKAQAISLGSNDDHLAALLASVESAVRTLPPAHPSSSAPEAFADMDRKAPEGH